MFVSVKLFLRRFLFLGEDSGIRVFHLMSRLLVLQAINKILAKEKHSSLFDSNIGEEFFYNIDTWVQNYKTFYGHNVKIFVLSLLSIKYCVCPIEACLA